MKNYVQPGDTLELTAPYQRNSGEGALIGTLFGVATVTVANGAKANFATKGVFDITKLTADVVTEGAKMYWDNTNRRLTTTSAGNTLVGVATQAQSGTDTTCRTRLGIVA